MEWWGNSHRLAIGDPLFADVVLLILGNGDNNSTEIVDSSLANCSITIYGNARISTAQSVYGGSSIIFDGNNDYLIATSAALALGTGDFTLETWEYRYGLSAVAGAGIMFDFRTAEPQENILFFYDSNYSISYYNNGANRIVSATTFGVNLFRHVALCRTNGITRIFVDGIQQGGALGTPLNFADTYNLTSTILTIGGRFAPVGTDYRSINGHLYGIRLTKAGRYTVGFTPPTPPFLAF